MEVSGFRSLSCHNCLLGMFSRPPSHISYITNQDLCSIAQQTDTSRARNEVFSVPFFSPSANFPLASGSDTKQASFHRCSEARTASFGCKVNTCSTLHQHSTTFRRVSLHRHQKRS